MNMNYDFTTDFWAAFALSGDPMAYLDYTKARGEAKGGASSYDWRKINENGKSARRGSKGV